MLNFDGLGVDGGVVEVYEWESFLWGYALGGKR